MRHYIKVLCDIRMEWGEISPVYRVYVNDELFGERKWIWKNQYLQELLQIEGPVGDYVIKYLVTDPSLGQLTVSDIKVINGNATVSSNIVRIFE